ncbi:hypothetical protein IV454_25045 [Massilia antarctica]|uniref:Uncharacterized protein n=1 Tax=Massilia antarctica TaxID=2765360 RepID=A0AA48WAC2_9BURK|nr:hypothetical protein [Massilia antarctica]QPI48747.1 hypothetical protein IV454_25045 [Massilia antarctica]
MKKSNIVVYAVVMGFLLYAAAYLYCWGRPACLMSDYEQRYWDFAGGRPDHALFDGRPDMSIKTSVLPPSQALADSAYTRTSLMIQCRVPLQDASRISYVEMRSAQLSAAIEMWLARRNDVTGFRHGTLKSGETLPDPVPSGRIKAPWHDGYAAKHAPEWYPAHRMNEQNFVAFWGDGYLFRGEAKDEYYWVGFN